MELQNLPFKEFQAKLLDIIGEFVDLDNHKIFVFGSQVTGKSHQGSDIDVGIMGPKRIPGDVMVNIRSKIDDLPWLYKIEFVDFDTTSEQFKQVALQNIKELKYDKK